jgi:hypothetical protein
MKLAPETAPIYVRVHTRVRNEKPRDYDSKLRDKWANFAFVFDCETATGIRQDLTFLWWRFCELKNDIYICQQEGVVYADGLDQQLVKLIRNYAHRKRADVEDGCPTTIRVNSRTEFVNKTFWEALRMGAVIVCFNAPFDLSRLALEYRKARSKNTGWSTVLWRYRRKADKLKPKLRIKPKDSRSAFINLAGGDPYTRLVYQGRFLDLSVLGWALRNKHLDLDGFLESFQLDKKMKHEPTGRVTKLELDYGRRDVERTVALLNAMKREYDGFPLELNPESAMSAASITKAFLNKMRVQRPAKKFNLPDETHGRCMQAYYGGRSEIRIRHQEMPVVVCDTTSEYPSVAALLNLWPLLIAADVKVEECTKEARNILNRTTIETLMNPSTWRELAFFASVRPADDILPVRSLYSEIGATTIGLNPLTSDQPIWYAGPDLAASKLKTKRTPEVIEAFRIVPQGIQDGMSTTTIGTRQIDPAKDDFFLSIIEERKTLPKAHPHYLLLKIIANSLYGIFAELNKYEYGKNKAKLLDVFSGEHAFDETTCVIERPGKWHFPPAAALITAGGRLMLSILERMAEDLGGTYLLTDTDSMLFVASEKGGLVPCPGGRRRLKGGAQAVRAITWKQVEQICAKLNGLNPYNRNFVDQILKIEDCNYDRAGNQHQLYGLAVSAKRYVVYTSRKSTRQIIKPSEHGLGIVYVPDKRKRYKPVDCKDQETSYPCWIVEAWQRLLSDHFRNVKDHTNALVSEDLWFSKFPAMMRIRVTTPNVMRALRKYDPAAGKPYNFALSPILVEPPPDCTLITRFSKHPEDWLTQNYTEIHSGNTVKLLAEYNGKQILPQTLSGILWRHYLHPEDKSLSHDGLRCDPYTRGLLLRRPIQAMTPFIFIGKEIERKSQEGEDISVLENRGPIRYQAGQTIKTRAADAGLILRVERLLRTKRVSKRRLTRESGVYQHSVERFLSGARLHPSTRVRLARAVEKLEREARDRA